MLTNEMKISQIQIILVQSNQDFCCHTRGTRLRGTVQHMQTRNIWLHLADAIVRFP